MKSQNDLELQKEIDKLRQALYQIAQIENSRRLYRIESESNLLNSIRIISRQALGIAENDNREDEDPDEYYICAGCDRKLKYPIGSSVNISETETLKFCRDCSQIVEEIKKLKNLDYAYYTVSSSNVTEKWESENWTLMLAHAADRSLPKYASITI